MRVRSLVVFASLVGCHADATRAAPAPDDGAVVGPGGPWPGGDGGSKDAAVDARSDATDAADAGDGPARIVGTVRTSAGLASKLSGGTPRGSVKLSALKFGGGTTLTTTALDGSFSLTNVDTTATPAWVSVSDPAGGHAKTLAGIAVSRGGTVTMDLPLFAIDAVASANALVGLPPPDSTKTFATVVVRVVDKTGAPVSGAKSSKAGGAQGPFYDDGVDLGPSGASTGKQGVIVFLQVPVVGGGLPIVVTVGSTTLPFTAALEGDAITWVTLAP